MQYEKLKPFDKNGNRIYSKEVEKELLLKRVARMKKAFEQRPIKPGSGKICINNGVINKMQLADLPIPEGWEVGRKKKGV